MATPAADTRSSTRRELDEQLAAEPVLAPLSVPTDAIPLPLESHLHEQRPRSLAVAGIVENGLIRPLDLTVKLAEHSRVIVVAAE